MSLNQFVAEARLKILGELKEGKPPSVGEFSDSLLREGQSKGAPQLGATRYEPDTITVEFIFPAAGITPTVLPVRIPAPERIVFMPVPAWVVESIWQGEIDGSFHFESHANQLVEAFREQLSIANNFALFGDKAPTRRG
jgi:hypothetical protein